MWALRSWLSIANFGFNHVRRLRKLRPCLFALEGNTTAQQRQASHQVRVSRELHVAKVRDGAVLSLLGSLCLVPVQRGVVSSHMHHVLSAASFPVELNETLGRQTKDTKREGKVVAACGLSH